MHERDRFVAFSRESQMTVRVELAWVAYITGADSTGLSGSSLFIHYSPSGAVLKTFSIAGSVDGRESIQPGMSGLFETRNS